jgi:hypothetical protein
LLNEKALPDKPVLVEWLPKQKRAFQCITTGLKLAHKNNKKVRFLTLTTSELQKNNILYDEYKLNDSIRKLKQRIQRITVMELLKNNYIKSSDIRRYYSNQPLNKKFNFQYFRIRTNEGNGVAHILYKGNYIPYNWLVDNWFDLHNSWNIDIKLIKNNVKKTSRYLVSQYLSNQGTSFVRSSQSWDWIKRNYRQEWYNFLNYCQNKYYYNPVQKRYYRKNKYFNDNQTTLTDINEYNLKGISVNIFNEWYDYIYNITNKNKKIIQTKIGA